MGIVQTGGMNNILVDFSSAMDTPKEPAGSISHHKGMRPQAFAYDMTLL